MDILNNLMLGFGVLFTPENLLAGIVGAFVGTLIGVLPGIGPVGAMSLLLPTTFALGPVAGIVMLAGIYYGSMYGGSTTSILLRIPGVAASVVTVRDGYPMAQRGRAGSALAITAIASAIAGTLGVIAMMLFAPPLAQFALAFGPPEFALIALLGLVALAFFSGGSFVKGALMAFLGLAIATVGMDSTSGRSRFTFGNIALSGGIDLVPIVMGIFGVAEVLRVLENSGSFPRIGKIRLRELYPSRQEWRESLPAIGRGTGLGFSMGLLLPGPMNVVSSFASYRMEQRVSKHPERFGHGAVAGVAGPEAANSAASSGQMVPLLAIGVPFSAAEGLLLAALIVHNVNPGPMLISEHPDIFWGVIASMYFGNLILLILNLPLIGMWVSMLRLQQSVLMMAIMIVMLVGAYSLNNRIFDIWVMLVAGVLGYLLHRYRFDPAPLVLGLVLGGFFETTFRQALFIGRGDLGIFVDRPISLVLVIVIAAVLVVVPVGPRVLRRRRARGLRRPDAPPVGGPPSME